MGNFTFEETNLLCIYNTGSRTGLIEALTEMCGELSPEEAELRELTDSADPQNPGDIQKIARTYQAFVDGALQDEKGFCAVATTEQIAAQDYILTPGRYVGIQEQQDDGEPFEEKMQRLTAELSDLFRQSNALEQEIREKLGAIGYEV